MSTPTISLSYMLLCHIYAHFLKYTNSNSNANVTAENTFPPFYRRPGWKHKLICCFKYLTRTISFQCKVVFALIEVRRHSFLPPQRTLDLEYQDGGDELQNLITEITEMRDLGLFISVDERYILQRYIIQSHRPEVVVFLRLLRQVTAEFG